MKRIHLFILLACVCTAGITSLSCSSAENNKSGNGETQSQSTTITPGKMQTTDALSGKPVSRAIYADHEGKRIYFCCEQSRETFRTDPGKYLDAFKSQGVTLENTP